MNFLQQINVLGICVLIQGLLSCIMPANRKYDGFNLLPFLNANSASVPHETLFRTGFSLRSEKPHFDEPEGALARHYRQIGGDRYSWAIRHKNWKLRYFGESDKYALYDLEKDTW